MQFMTMAGGGVLQVKKNCPELYAELMRLFEGLSEDRENDPKGFQDKYGNDYSYQLLRGSISFPMVEVWRHTQEEIKRFKKMSNAVLFASGSCWEGVDFPGDMVSSLIIVRLPFSVPDPVQEAEKEQYGNLREYIDAVAVPDMQKKLRQGFGRAIRTETDTCVVTILDQRAARGGR